MNILVAMNSYKECADSVAINDIICRELSGFPGLKLISKPLSDGGDGFLSVIRQILKVRQHSYLIYDFINSEDRHFDLYIDESTSTGFIESAKITGLAGLVSSLRKPMRLSTETIGAMIKNIAGDVITGRIDIKTLIIGVGGTSTIDMGLGACAAMGLELFDGGKNKLDVIPANFNRTESINFIKTVLPFSIKCVTDVDTELLGSPGAVEIYGRQKGASDEEMILIRSGIEKIIAILSQDPRFTVPRYLNGAGGGLAAGLNIFFDAVIIPSGQFIKEFILKDVDKQSIDAVITGEGQFDQGSFEGKGAGTIIKIFEKSGTPVYLINGSTVLPEEKLPQNCSVVSLSDFYPDISESILNYRSGLKKAVELLTEGPGKRTFPSSSFFRKFNQKL